MIISSGSMLNIFNNAMIIFDSNTAEHKEGLYTWKTQKPALVDNKHYVSCNSETRNWISS